MVEKRASELDKQSQLVREQKIDLLQAMGNQKALEKMLADQDAVVKMSDSARCINECVLVGKHFCPGKKRLFGYCSPDKKQFKKNDNEEKCSYEAPQGSGSLKWFSCPHTPAYCGREDVLEATLKTQKKGPKGFFSEFLKDGAACRYEIGFPVNAGKYD